LIEANWCACINCMLLLVASSDKTDAATLLLERVNRGDHWSRPTCNQYFII